MTVAPFALLARVEALARRAGEVILDVYRQPFAVQDKADGSPVTLADERAEALITAGLRSLEPLLPVVAEEAVGRGERPMVDTNFWLVDPLDGTREFVARNGEFTVNIALVEDGEPVLRVVFAPSLGRLFAGEADLYPRFGRKMEWDATAGHAVLIAVGGHVHDLAGMPRRSGKPGFDNPDFVATGADAAG